MSEEYKRKPNTKCFICHKAVYKRPSQIKKNKGRVFCNQACYGLYCRREVSCVVCGKKILGGMHKKTCSRTCSNVQRAGIKYKTGSLKDKVRSSQALKIRLLAERGKKCERCDYAVFEILQIHHKDRNREHNDLENLELVCPNCHYSEHLLEKSWLRNKK